MNDPITPSTIARLRELMEKRRQSEDEWKADPHSADACSRFEHRSSLLAGCAIKHLPALLDQLDAQAAEIERLNKGFHESCIAREEAANARAKKAEASVAELTALIRSIYAQDVEDDQQSPVEDLLRHQAGEYGKARCRVRELERELASLRESQRKIDADAGGCALSCDGAGCNTMSELSASKARVAELEAVATKACDAWFRNHACELSVCALMSDLDAVLAKREGGR